MLNVLDHALIDFDLYQVTVPWPGVELEGACDPPSDFMNSGVILVIGDRTYSRFTKTREKKFN